MLQTFFTDTLISKFIKEFLYKTPTPLVDTCVDGDYVVAGFHYIYNHTIVKCLKSGVISQENSRTNFKYVSDYVFGEQYLSLTENYISKYEYYDTDTHMHLGNTLRVIRDELGIDLMPFYNCFGYKVIQGLHLEKKGSYVVPKHGERDGVKLIAIPIKFGKTYTICIDSNAPYLMCPVFINGTRLVESYSNVNIMVDYSKVSKEEIHGSRFNAPFTYKVTIDEYAKATEIEESILYDWQKNLYLIIQLPIANNSSILVQEGDYTGTTYISDFMPPFTKASKGGNSEGTTIESQLKDNLGTNKIINFEFLQNFNTSTLNKALSSPLSLQRLNSQVTYAFSNRLIEYLLLNVIDNLDQLSGDISRVQSELHLNDAQYSKGVWTNKLRVLAYKYFASNLNNYKGNIGGFSDTNGFIDKDIETILERTKI